MELFDWLGRPLALDFANTVWPARRRGPVDAIASISDLRVWLDRAAIAATTRDLEPRLDDLRGLRSAVRQLLSAASKNDLLPRRAMEIVNLFATEAPEVRQIVPDGKGSRVVSEILSDDPASLLFGRIAVSTMAVLTTKTVGVCPAPSCGLFFVVERAGQLWCSNACGNRARVARHAAKRYDGSPRGSEPRPSTVPDGA
jgi:predicted RNA-binding Zn ribbon-like protein